jgi:hypothetical protein
MDWYPTVELERLSREANGNPKGREATAPGA